MNSTHGVARCRRAVRPGLSLILTLSLASCGGAPVLAPPPPKPRTVEIQISVSADANPNAEGRPSPVVLHVFVLKDSGAFSAAKFDPLTQDAAGTLGDALLAQEQQIVRPGDSLKLPLKVDPAAGYIGAVAEYSDVLGAQWRAVMAAPEKKLLDFLSKKPVQIEVGRKVVLINASP